ncbi:hypothetical protein DHEL01_v202022 [Diaporthe helianthi]|uniref:Fungal N-terminal domain-containing protein n=1 Tax=Diaporthe helianthi TaxID=158607 RepID=A0A2P5IAW4_DIAHE|nr:hypothetical protein DHEL01_v202022 [Diaporthe helianthi]
MDPLSMTSGVVGIVAFAFQLAKTASKVRTAMEEMNSAPRDAKDLIERLKMLETACELISAHLEGRKALPNYSLSPSFGLITKAMTQFLGKAEELEQMLANLTSSNGSTGSLRARLDAAGVSRLRFVLRKDKINNMVQDIDRVMLLLQFVMQADMCNTPSGFNLTWYDDPSDASEVTEIMLSARSQDMVETDMIYLIDSAVEPEYFIHVDIHQQWYFNDSAYMYLLKSANHPFTADCIAYEWLNMLKACGVDLGSYVEVETALVQEVGVETELEWSARRRGFALLDYDGLQIPSWRWVLPAGSNIVEILHEFINFGSDVRAPRFPGPYMWQGVNPTGPDDDRAWKRWEGPWDRFWTDKHFPFCPSPIDSILATDHVLMNQPWYRATYNRAVKIRDDRFARRQARKWRKAHPGEEPPSNQVPGTWVD